MSECACIRNTDGDRVYVMSSCPLHGEVVDDTQHPHPLRDRLATAFAEHSGHRLAQKKDAIANDRFYALADVAQVELEGEVTQLRAQRNEAWNDRDEMLIAVTREAGAEFIDPAKYGDRAGIVAAAIRHYREEVTRLREANAQLASLLRWSLADVHPPDTGVTRIAGMDGGESVCWGGNCELTYRNGDYDVVHLPDCRWVEARSVLGEQS